MPQALMPDPQDAGMVVTFLAALRLSVEEIIALGYK